MDVLDGNKRPVRFASGYSLMMIMMMMMMMMNQIANQSIFLYSRQ